MPHAQNNFKLQTIKQEITGTPYEGMDGKFYIDCNGSLRTITWKDYDDERDILRKIFRLMQKSGKCIIRYGELHQLYKAPAYCFYWSFMIKMG